VKHLSVIQHEFLKQARKWKDMSLEDQRAYLERHPLSKLRLTSITMKGKKEKIPKEAIRLMNKAKKLSKKYYFKNVQNELKDWKLSNLYKNITKILQDSGFKEEAKKYMKLSEEASGRAYKLSLD